MEFFCDSKVKQEKLNKQPEKCRIRDNIINVDEHFCFSFLTAFDLQNKKGGEHASLFMFFFIQHLESN
jgi:hypothetical protein